MFDTLSIGMELAFFSVGGILQQRWIIAGLIQVCAATCAAWFPLLLETNDQ
jgi:hypothetical protein